MATVCSKCMSAELHFGAGSATRRHCDIVMYGAMATVDVVRSIRSFVSI